MRFGVSAWRLSGQRFGIGRYIEYMLTNWARCLDAEDRVRIFVHEPPGRQAAELPDAFSTHVIRPRLTNALWENLLLPSHAGDFDVLFGPSYTLPLWYKGRSVVSIHSMDDVQPGYQAWRHRWLYESKYRRSAHVADAVIANSHYVKARIVAQWGVPEENVEVVWLGVDPVFRPVCDPEILRQTRLKYLGADVPYILFVGGLSTRRNVPMLIEAFARLKRDLDLPHRLLLFGPNRANLPLEELARRNGVSGSVVQTDGQIGSHADLVPIYGGAEMFVLPSSTEGFSLTLLEAMACGAPAVTVNQAALGEFAHGYAMTIDEPEIDALVGAMRQIATEPDVRRRVQEKCLERARGLTWARTAEKTLGVLRRVGMQASRVKA